MKAAARFMSKFAVSSLKTRILINIVIFTSIPILFSTVFIQMVIRQNIMGEYKSIVEKNALKSVELINQEITSYLDKSNFIFANKYLISSLQQDFNEDIEEMMYFYDNIKMFGSGLESPDYENQEPFTLYIYNESLYEGDYIEHIDKIENEAFFQQIMYASSSELLWNPNLVQKDSALFLAFYRNLSFFSERIGILEFHIPFKKIKYYMDFIGAPENGEISYRNSAGSIIYSSVKTGKSQQIGAGAADNLKLSFSLNNGDELIVLAPLSTVNKKVKRTSLAIWAAFLLLIMVVLYASNKTSKKISGKLNAFIAKLKVNNSLNSGFLNGEKMDISGNDEISVIQQKFMTVIDNMNRTYQESLAVKRQNTALEMELHQSMINPHLLYNSLSVMRWPALRNRDFKTVELIDAMTQYYRLTLNKGNIIIRIADEMEMIRQYVKINECAHSREYGLDIRIEEEVSGLFTFKHLVQPIVENAIVHGLNGIDEGAGIGIRGRRIGPNLEIEVADNGHGMDREKLESVRRMSYRPQIGGYGLRNVINRIHGYYGNRFGIQIESSTGQGTKVRITIPIMEKEELTAKVLHA